MAELIDGEISEEKNDRVYDNELILDLLRKTKEMIYGILLVVMGIALRALSYTL